jgi:DNA repair exonuclease SbcCD ATPase subunit
MMMDARILTPNEVDARILTLDEVDDVTRAGNVLSLVDSHEALRAKLAEVDAELQRIDSVMARRPALDKPTRAQNIEHAIDTARRATEEVVRLQRDLSDVRQAHRDDNLRLVDQRQEQVSRAAAAERRVREVEADRADILARRDQVLDDLRQSLEAEIAARKLVEAKLTVAEAERDEARKELDLWQHCANCHERMDAPGHCSRAESEGEAGYRVMWEQQMERAEKAEAALARVREALRNLVAKLDAIEPHVSNVCAIA